MDIIEEWLCKKIDWYTFLPTGSKTDIENKNYQKMIKNADKYAKILAERTGWWDEDRK